MKKWVFCLLFTMFCGFLQAQGKGAEIEEFLLSSAGATQNITSGAGFSYVLTWTIGDPFTEMYQASKKIMTQGLLQVNPRPLTSSEEELLPPPLSMENPGSSKELEFSFYPNPTQNILHISLSSLSSERFDMNLFDMQGRCLYSCKIPSGQKDKNIDMSSLHEGLYVLRLYGNESKQSHVFRIVKN